MSETCLDGSHLEYSVYERESELHASTSLKSMQRSTASHPDSKWRMSDREPPQDLMTLEDDLSDPWAGYLPAFEADRSKANDSATRTGSYDMAYNLAHQVCDEEYWLYCNPQPYSSSQATEYPYTNDLELSPNPSQHDAQSELSGSDWDSWLADIDSTLTTSNTDTCMTYDEPGQIKTSEAPSIGPSDGLQLILDPTSNDGYLPSPSYSSLGSFGYLSSVHDARNPRLPRDASSSSRLSSPVSYLRHSRNSTRSTTCPTCGKSFSYPKDLKRHSEARHPELSDPKLVFCNFRDCTFSTARPDKLTQHKKARHASPESKSLSKDKLKPHRCEVPGCNYDKPFVSMHDLRRHKISKHPETVEDRDTYYICAMPGCRSRGKWTRLDNFRQHIQRRHRGDADLNTLIDRSKYRETTETIARSATWPQTLESDGFEWITDDCTTECAPTTIDLTH